MRRWTAPRRLTVIGDVACDPDSDYNPVPVYDRHHMGRACGACP